VAVKLAPVAPASTVTNAGTLTAGLLLDRLTLSPPFGAAVLRVKLHASVADPASVPFAQLNDVRVGKGRLVPVPLRPIAIVLSPEALLVTVNAPVTAPVVFGSNCTLSVTAWFGLSVSGTLIPETEKPLPVALTPLIVTGWLPVEVSVRGCVAAVFTFTLLKARPAELAPSVAIAALSWIAKVCDAPAAFAVSVAVCWVVTAAIFAAKFALLEPAGTTTEAGTTIALLSLVNATVTPLLRAAVPKLTVHETVPAPVIALFPQTSPLSAGTLMAVPVPLKLTIVGLPVDESLVKIN